VDPVVVNPSILLLSSSLVLGCHLSHMIEERRESHNRCRNIDLSLINKRICVAKNYPRIAVEILYGKARIKTPLMVT
jgi:hypothetical protein